MLLWKLMVAQMIWKCYQKKGRCKNKGDVPVKKQRGNFSVSTSWRSMGRVEV